MRADSRKDDRNHFLVVGLQGGLGNQIFQYASAMGIAAHLGADVFFDSSHLRADERWLPKLIGSNYREVERGQLLRLGFVPRGSRGRDRVVRALVRRGVDTERRVRTMSPRLVPVGGDLEDPGRYRESLLSIDTPAYLWGFLQSERYFSSVAEQLAATLALPPVALPASDDSRPTVAVSFRRGDYVRLGWALPLSYYSDALEIIVRQVENPKFLLFGDDPDFLDLVVGWVSQYGPAASAYDIARDELAQLALLRACDHCVIANSSFAWWGAWLGDRHERSTHRLVLAPEQYHRFGEDIMPERWVAVAGAEFSRRS